MLGFQLASGINSRLQAHEEKAFISWMRETNQLFTGDEYHARLGIWINNKRFVQQHNSKGEFQLSMNHLAHLTQAEYKALLGFKGVSKGQTVKAMNLKDDVPDTVDWRQSGLVNPIKNQGNCGSCWAFSTIQAQEGVYAKTHGNLYSLSEQNLVDCVTSCSGCNGGLMHEAYQYVIANQQGLFNLEVDYPYTAKDGTCKFDVSKGYAKVTGDFQVTQGDENALKVASATYGPIAIAIDASHFTFQLYHSGIYDPWFCSSSNLDHAVGLIGYGTDKKDYWLVRNSWGTSWGESGYIRMVRNKNNKCGVATMAFVPQV